MSDYEDIGFKDAMSPYLEKSKKEFEERTEKNWEKVKKTVLGEDAAKDYATEYPNANKEINLKPIYSSLRKALDGFQTLCKLIVKSNFQTNESFSPVRLSNYNEQINEIKKHINETKTFIIGDSVINGIRCPSEQTIFELDTNLKNIDAYTGLDNLNVKHMFEAIKLGKIHFQDIVEFEKFFKQIYLELCSCVLAYYNSVIITIGDRADFEHSNQNLIDYFNKKGIKNGNSNYPLIPSTKNIFNELIHPKALGPSDTKDFIKRSDFNAEIARRQANNKLLQKPF